MNRWLGRDGEIVEPDLRQGGWSARWLWSPPAPALRRRSPLGGGLQPGDLHRHVGGEDPAAAPGRCSGRRRSARRGRSRQRCSAGPSSSPVNLAASSPVPSFTSGWKLATHAGAPTRGCPSAVSPAITPFQLEEPAKAPGRAPGVAHASGGRRRCRRGLAGPGRCCSATGGYVRAPSWWRWRPSWPAAAGDPVAARRSSTATPSAASPVVVRPHPGDGDRSSAS